jgi:succinoglycan biosynthesis protein ExoM
VVTASVCIATLNRPIGLDRLLSSLEAQNNAPEFEVVVIDNNPHGTACPVVANFADRLALTYVIEAEPGLAAVRNRAVQASVGDFIAFIDDDEWATPPWLGELHAKSIAVNADLVFGPIEVQFEDDVKDYVRACGLFDIPALADGETVPWYLTRTGNAYVRRSALPDQSAPFDRAFDFTGGEDVHLFRRMVDRGGKAVFAASARVFERRESSRANLRWAIRRALRNGGTIVDVDWSQLGGTERLRRSLAKAARGAADGFTALQSWRSDRTRSTRELLEAMQAMGTLLRVAGWRIEEYRSPT